MSEVNLTEIFLAVVHGLMNSRTPLNPVSRFWQEVKTITSSFNNMKSEALQVRSFEQFINEYYKPCRYVHSKCVA